MQSPPRPEPAWAGGGGPSGAAAIGAAPSAATRAPTSEPTLTTFPGRVQRVLLSPRSEWTAIAAENASGLNVLVGYVLPLAAIAAAIGFVHLSLVGTHLPFGGTVRTPPMVGIEYALLTLIGGLVGTGCVGLIIYALAPMFGGTRDIRQALKVAAYSFTPAWVSVLFGLVPVLGFLLQLLAGLYGIYLLYLGLPVVMGSRRESAVGYTASVVVCTILLGVVLGALNTSLGVGWGPGLGGHDFTSRTDAQRDAGATATGNLIGDALGTDDRGKANLGAAISNLAQAGEHSSSQASAPGGSGASGASGSDAAASSAGQSSASDGATTAKQDAANPMAAAGGLLTALGGALGGGRHVEPVDFHKLEGFLPTSLSGLTRTQLQGGGHEAVGVKGTSATAHYQDGNGAQVEVEITDASGVSGLMDLAGSLAMNDTSESDTGYEKQAVVGGRSVHEKFDRTRRHGEVSAILAKRFTVDITGDAVDMATLERAFGGLDLRGLEALSNAGAR